MPRKYERHPTDAHLSVHGRAMKHYVRRRRSKLVAALGGQCVKCGFADGRALQVDHKHGGGAKERKALSRWGYEKAIWKNLKRYQLLCANCNWIKRYEEDGLYGK